MKVTADTNVLLRTIVDDDEAQTTQAVELLEAADMVAVSLQSLCELVWVLCSRYGAARADIAAALRMLLNTNNVVVNRPAAEAGLEMLDAGGDFADGVIAYDGTWLGAETFVSFDKKAVSLLTKQGHAARLL
ncbi:type II toxin-antitoxin system VapC family toxin [Xylella taiwanensis]|uniref:DNA-binding protein n=1 Tax=Xylella taiwanensis TaxID=1444770 RepID=Z9JIF0_9GAMM|nr:type II toxin-antitoxin system VapC family toxin [Xylella taiwanensis]AXI83452.1 DNA-binding protein [Xylella taiwanensis]EWS77507.1 DNA-binding protein [Xylella taiwanensis]MCD8456523.1 type II toxin-antitoxin system VapC family toxin [Xylella taiwanensis]MCD8458930.1 type II toxin-antitoxin system VapC family toxin [Xylella taiwanensis]MCD8461068.1 type II toxin-antitoxin system VapC family toxin [Xylella taiwanensis]